MSSAATHRRRSLLVLLFATALVGATPALAAGDLSKATIEREDLPAGFREVPPGQLSEAGISTRQVGKSLAAYLTDARLLAYSVHATPSGDEVVESFLVGPLSEAEQAEMDRQLADEATIADSFSGAFVTLYAETSAPEFLKTEGVGDSSLGFQVVITTPSELAHLESLFGGATGDRASVALVFGRRGEYLHFVAVVHLGAGRPSAHVVELARILDDKVGYRQGIEGFGPEGRTTDDDPNLWLLLASLATVVAAGLLLGRTLRQRRLPATTPATAAAAVMTSQPYVPGLPAAPPAWTPSSAAAPEPAARRARLVGRLVALAGWLMVLGWLAGIVAFTSKSEGLAWMTWGKSSIALYSPPVLAFVWGIPLIVLGGLMGRTRGRGAADERIDLPPQRIGRRLIGLGIGALPLVGMAFLSSFLVTGTIRDDGAEVQLGAWIGLAAAILGLLGATGAIGVGILLRRRRASQPVAGAFAAPAGTAAPVAAQSGLPPAPPPPRSEVDGRAGGT